MVKASKAQRFKISPLASLAVISLTVSVIGLTLSGVGSVSATQVEACNDDTAEAAEADGSLSIAQGSIVREVTKEEVPAPDFQLFWNGLNKTWLSDEQMALLNKAYEIGFQDGGHEHAEIVQAVLLQETIAGQLGRIGHLTAPVGKRSYGVMQVKVSAARDVLRHFKGEFGRFKADEQLIAQLMMDDEFNLRMGSKFLLHLAPKAKSVEKMLVAYNIGLRASRSVNKPGEFKYVVRTMNNLNKVVKPFNERFQVQEPVQLALN